MTQLVFNKKIANEILNNDSLRDELIVTLNELIDAELLKSDDEIDFELIDTYTDALNELYMGKDIAAVFWKLQTVEEFIDSITSNKKVNHLAKIFKIVAVACAFFAIVATSDKVTKDITGEGIATHVSKAVREILTGEVFRQEPESTAEGTNTDRFILNEPDENTISEESTDEQGVTQTPITEMIPQIELPGLTQTESTTNKVSSLLPNWTELVPQPTAPQTESTTTPVKEESTTKPNTTETTTQKQEATTNKPTQVTPQNPSLPEVLKPTTPPKTETTTKPQEETFTRVDEDVTSAPVVVKLTGTFDKNFKRDYVVGERADYSGLTVTAKYDNGTTKTIPLSQCRITGFSTSKVQNCIVKVEYEGCSFSFLIRVKDEESTTAPAVSETTTQKPETTTQAPTTTKPHNPELPTVLTPTDPPQTETTTKPQEETFTRPDEDVTSAPTVIKLKGEYASGFKKEYTVGEKADYSGLKVIAEYDNGESREIPLSQCKITGFSTETAGNKVVKVEYKGCSFSFLIKVKEEN